MRVHLRRLLYSFLLINVLAFLFLILGRRDNIHSTERETERIYTPSRSVTLHEITAVKPREIRPRHNGTWCDGIRSPTGVLQDKQIWVRLDGANAYVFAAFHDNVSASVIRIIGTQERGSKRNFHCQLWFDQEEVSGGIFVVGAEVKYIPEDHGKRFRAVFYLCKIPIQAKPYAVSLVSSKCGSASNVLPVLSSDHENRKFTVCVTPFNYNYGRAYELVEFIELNRILGADKIMFYNYSTNHNVDHVLKWYTEKNIAQVINWKLPMKVDTWPRTNDVVEIHYFAQLAALNDCLYRNLHASQYLVYEDLDEFIIPRKTNNWTAMVDQLNGSASVGGFIVRNTFFRKEWDDTDIQFDRKSLAKKYKSVTLLKLAREVSILPIYHRSKYIIQPTKIETLGIHNIWRLRPGMGVDFVPVEMALLHHYRNWEKPDDGTERIADDIVLKYKDKLIKSLEDIWTRFEGIAMDIPLQKGGS